VLSKCMPSIFRLLLGHLLDSSSQHLAFCYHKFAHNHCNIVTMLTTHPGISSLFSFPDYTHITHIKCS
jgi:hypothetical protein